MNEALLRELIPAVTGVLVRRGADFARAEDAVQDALLRALATWPDGAAGGSEGLVDHGRLAQVPGREPGGELPARPRDPGRGRAGTGPDRGGRHPAALLPVRPPFAHAVLRGGAHAACRGRPDDPPDRGGVPGARGDHGPAHQPGQAHRVGRALRRDRGRGHRPAGALPGLQRGLQRRGRPRRRGDPADPPGQVDDRRRGGVRSARADAAAPCTPRRPDDTRRHPRPAGGTGPVAVGHRA